MIGLSSVERMSVGTTVEQRQGEREADRRGIRHLRVFAALGGLSQSLAGGAAALLAREVTGSDAAGGLPQALLVVGAGTSALGLAGLARRLGRASALSVGAVAAALGSVAMAWGGLGGVLGPILFGSLLLGAGNTAVMLSRYAAAELDPGRPAPRAMASVLVATSVGAVVGPNLMLPSGMLAGSFDVPPLIGSYLVAAIVYLAGAAVILRTRRALPPVAQASTSSEPSTPAGRFAVLRRGTEGRAGLAVLAVANLVMVGVMTMAPIHLDHLGGGLWLIGVVISAHIAAMFAPSAFSGWLTERLGARLAAAGSAAVLVLACVVAMAAAHSTVVLAVAMVILGLGWNGCLVSGSALLTHGVAAGDRPGREGVGEAGMAAAAVVGGATSGLVMARWDYSTLALHRGGGRSCPCHGSRRGAGCQTPTNSRPTRTHPRNLLGDCIGEAESSVEPVTQEAGDAGDRCPFEVRDEYEEAACPSFEVAAECRVPARAGRKQGVAVTLSSQRTGS